MCKLNEGEQAYINIIELAIDMNLKVTQEDYKRYDELIERREQNESCL